MIYGISGYAQVGKDEVGKIFVKEFGYTRRSFADSLRNAVYALNPIIGYCHDADGIVARRVQEQLDASGYEYTKKNFPEYRRLLQYMGTEVGRKLFGEDFWVNQTLKDLTPDSKVVITDVRFVNEAEAIRQLGGTIIRVDRPGVGPQSDHPSETSMDHYEGYSRWMNNDGSLSDLREKVKKIFQQ